MKIGYQISNRFIALLVLVVVTAGTFAVYSNSKKKLETPSYPRETSTPRGTEANRIHIIVVLDVTFQPEGNLLDEEVTAQRQAIAQAQDNLLAKLGNYNVTDVTKYSYTPSISMEADSNIVDYLRSLAEVSSVKQDIPEKPSTP
jgi:hypothetical protein